MLKNACWHCNSLYRGRFYVWASGLCSLYRKIRYLEVLFHTFHCTYLWPGHRISFVISRTSLNRGSLNRGSLNRGPTVQAKLYVHEQTSLSAYTVFSWPLERDFFYQSHIVRCDIFFWHQSKLTVIPLLSQKPVACLHVQKLIDTGTDSNSNMSCRKVTKKLRKIPIVSWFSLHVFINVRSSYCRQMAAMRDLMFCKICFTVSVF